jgi:hypothetical protein
MYLEPLPILFAVLSIFAWIQRTTAITETNTRATAQANAEKQAQIALARQFSAQAQQS